MKKLNIITGTAVSYGLQQNMEALNLLFAAMTDNGLPFKGEGFCESLLESRKAIDQFGLTEEAIYNNYENYVFPIRSANILKNLKIENISYKVINIKNLSPALLVKEDPHLSESGKIAQKISLELAEKSNFFLEKEYSEALSNTSTFEVLNVSVADLNNKLSEIISFFKN